VTSSVIFTQGISDSGRREKNCFYQNYMTLLEPNPMPDTRDYEETLDCSPQWPDLNI
jgi:hypothetical protein